ncbi:MAG: hypothetical protein JSW00_18700 [Thermoplasmata archaeon]|nr:MAG: hypothetical protein JSW00_18700 [Thermoplasmata archaeon]
MEEENVTCDNCGDLVRKEWTFEDNNGIICEDCYIDRKHTIKICDPLAVNSAKRFRELTGQKGTDGLSDLQKQIYDLVQSKGKVEPDELIQTFNLSTKQLENQIAILRHCELIKGKKMDGEIFLVPF